MSELKTYWIHQDELLRLFHFYTDPEGPAADFDRWVEKYRRFLEDIGYKMIIVKKKK